MQYVTRTPILAFQYNQEALDQLPAWIAENAEQPLAKDPTGTLMVPSGGQDAYGPSHTLVEPGSYIVLIAGRFESYTARRFEALFVADAGSVESNGDNTNDQA